MNREQIEAWLALESMAFCRCGPKDTDLRIVSMDAVEGTPRIDYDPLYGGWNILKTSNWSFAQYEPVNASDISSDAWDALSFEKLENLVWKLKNEP